MREEEADFGELFRLDADALYRFALIRLRNVEEAEDAVQDAFLRLCRRRDAPRDFNSPRAWMFRVLESVCVDRRRAMSRRGRVFDGAALEPEHHVDPIALNPERSAATSDELRGALSRLRRLPEVDAAALALVAIDGMSYDEVAEIMNVPIGTVRSRVSRARQAMRRLRDAPEPEEEPSGPRPGNVVPMPRRARRGSE